MRHSRHNPEFPEIVLVGLLLIWVLAIVCVAQVFGQDADKPPAVREIVKPEVQLSKRILLVLDTSSSMAPHVNETLQIVRAVARAPVDDFELAIITFDTRVGRWPGVADPPEEPHPVPAGWARLPSADALKWAETWLQCMAPRGDGTEPSEALKLALHEPRSDLSIVYVTDGEYRFDAATDAIREGQAWRRDQALGEAVIAVYGIVSSADGLFSEHLQGVAKAGRGGMWVPQAIHQEVMEAQIAPVRSN